jgi:3-carboxy-cis,cis-muconate cycloisomerase
MRANLEAAGGLPLAEHVTAVLAPSLGRLAAHELVASASARAASGGISLPDALLADPAAAATLRENGIGPAELAAAADPAGYLGASAEFVRRALAAHGSRGD